MIDWSRGLAYVLIAAAVLVLLAILSLATSDSASAEHADDTPTCSDTLGGALGDNHGEHVLDAYVGSPGGGPDPDPPTNPGGPGAHGHFEAPGPPAGTAPGASFCLDEAQSPGTHLGPN